MLVGGLVSADTTRPAVSGKTVTLAVNKSVTLGGVTITFGAANHKHAVDGGSLGMWTFVAKKGTAKKQLEIRSEDSHFEAEVALHGVAFVFHHISYESFAITLVARKAPRPLADDACADRVSAHAKTRGLPEGTSRSHSNDNGIVVVRTDAWQGYCGTLTKRVWIENPNAIDDAK